MANLLQVTGGVIGTMQPGTSWAAPNGLFPTTDRNDGSAYTWTSSTSTVTLPASDLADGYLFLWGYETEDSSNGRYNPQGKMVQASGTGNFETAVTGGYSRDNSEDRAYVSGWSFADGPSASATFQFQWQRDSDAPGTSDGTVRSFLQVIPFYYSDIGLYSSTSTTATGGTTPVQIGSFTGTDGTNITISSSQVSVTGDNKRYLVLGSGYHDSVGAGSRTQRWFGLEIDGTFDDAAKGCMYYRLTSCDEGGESFIRLLETATATRTIEVNQYRGNGVAAGDGGADVDGSTTSTAGAHALVVIELNDSAEVYSSVDSVGGQEFAVAGPVDVDIASTGDIEFNDSASFTRTSDTQVNCESDMDVFAFANISHAREASSIGSGSRWTVHGEFTIGGTEQTDVGFHGNYNRGNQTSQDCHGSSTNQAGVFSVTTGQDVGVSNQELSGTEGGGGDIETQAGWVGFGLINLDTLEDAGAAPITITAGAPDALAFTGHAPSRKTGLFFEGYAPTVSIDSATTPITAEPGVGSITFTGYAPTIEIEHFRDPNLGELTFTGYAPTVSLTDFKITEPTTGAIAFTGYAPTVGLSDFKITEPTIGSIAFTGYAATVELDYFRDIPSGSLTFTGYAPTVVRTESFAVEPTTGSIAFTGYAPSVEITHFRDVGAGALTFTGYIPSVSTGDNKFIDTTKGSLSFTGYAPSVEIDHVVDVPTGSVTFSGNTPTLAYSWTITPATGSLQFTGYAPAASTGDNKITLPGTGSLQFTGYPPTAEITHNRAVSSGSLALTGYAPSVEITHFVDVGTGALAFTGYAPNASVSDEQSVVPGVRALELTGYAPSVEITHIRDVPRGTLSFTGYAPSVLLGADKITLPSTGAVQITGYAPTVGLSFTVSPDTGTLNFSGYAPALGYDWTVLPGADSLTFTGYAPVIAFGTSDIPVPAGGLNFVGQDLTAVVAGGGVSITNPNATTSVPSNYEQCDFTGFRQLPGSLKMTWNKHAVRKKSWEERHPQDVLQGAPERQKGSRRPEKEDRFIEDIGEVEVEDL